MKNIKKLIKNGKHSLCLVIPKELLDDLKLDTNSFISIEKLNNGIFIKEVTINE